MKDGDKRSALRIGLLSLLGGVVVPVVYGLGLRLLFDKDIIGDKLSEVFVIVGIAYLFIAPFVIGFLSVRLLPRKPHGLLSFFFPFVPCTLILIGSMVAALEGAICVAMMAPLLYGIAGIGGVIAWLIPADFFSRIGNGPALIMIASLPIAASPIESQFVTPTEHRTVRTHIDMNADAAQAWSQIVSVPTISQSEHDFAWVHAIGFPKPVSAVVDRHGVGGKRLAKFERGVIFEEIVTTFDDNSTLAFSIHVDPDSIPAKGLDEHVTVGGDYFDVLEGEYEIEQLDSGVRLHLLSRYRLSTHLNFYAGAWTDFVMSDTQNHILKIIKRRAER